MKKGLRRLVICVLLVCCTTTSLRADFLVREGLSPGDICQIAFVTSGTRHTWSAYIADDNAFVQSQAELPGTMTADSGVNWSALKATLDGFDAQTQPVCGHPIDSMHGEKVAPRTGPPVLLINPIHVNQNGDTQSSLLWTGQSNFDIANPLGLINVT
jgi:hypothetical protein